MNRADASRKSSRKKGRRRYDNSLRLEQAEATRERIVEAVARELSDGKLEDFSIAKLAESAGVSSATIYRYFPNRAALAASVSRKLSKTIKSVEMPATAADLPEFTRKITSYFEANQELLRAQEVSIAMKQMNDQSRLGRDRKFNEILAPAVAHVDENTARARLALLRILGGSNTYLALRDRFGLDSGDATEAMAWALEKIVAALEAEAQAPIDDENQY